MFTMCETRMKKNVTSVVHRIKAKQDGRPFLRRNEQSYDPATEAAQVRGPQKIGDLEEVFEDSDNSDHLKSGSDDDDDVN